MRLDQKHFNTFMFGLAVISAIAIFYATLSFQGDQLSSFRRYINESDSLSSAYLKVLAEEDSVRIEDFKGKPVVLQFWSSWSDKSLQMQSEIQFVNEIDSLVLIAASVKDVLIDAEKHVRANGGVNTVFVDGTKIYNELKTPGIPSYVLFDKDGKPVHVKVGYVEGSIRDSLLYYVGDNE